MKRLELYPFQKLVTQLKKKIENDNPKLRTKNIIDQISFDITILEIVYTIITQLGFTLFHPLLIKNENNGFNPEMYTGLEKLKANLSGKLTITLITALILQVNFHGMNKKSLNRAAFLLENKSDIRAN